MRRSPAKGERRTCVAGPGGGSSRFAHAFLGREPHAVHAAAPAAAVSIAVSAALGASAAPASAVIALAPVRPCLSELDAVSPTHRA